MQSSELRRKNERLNVVPQQSTVDAINQSLASLQQDIHVRITHLTHNHTVCLSVSMLSPVSYMFCMVAPAQQRHVAAVILKSGWFVFCTNFLVNQLSG